MPLNLSTQQQMRIKYGLALSQDHVENQKINAKNADKYHLYQLSVQSPDPDIEFLKKVYLRENKKIPTHFREDFCGTALLSSTWINQGPEFTAEAFDIDPEPLNWGYKYNFKPLGSVSNQIILHQRDVRETSIKKPDVRCAQNFSYWIFTKRTVMLEYFKKCYQDIDTDGLYVIDTHGGQESTSYMEEETELDYGFSYVWDQCEYWPVTGEAKMKIHFRFKDSSEIKDAFTYEWRVWSIPELTELLYEAGFKRIDCYWEGTCKDGETGNGIFNITKKGFNDLAWVAYLVAVK